MRAIIQRVASAKVEIDGKVCGQIDRGLLALVGVHQSDTEHDAVQLASKIASLRIFSDGEGKMNLGFESIQPKPKVLAVSNFTVYGDAMRGRRPSFTQSANFELGSKLFSKFIVQLRVLELEVKEGVFGADMQVILQNDGPVTLVMDTKERLLDEAATSHKKGEGSSVTSR